MTGLAVRPARYGRRQGRGRVASRRGLCERGNYVRELPGWHIRVVDDGLHRRPHTVTITTPASHTYTSAAPEPP
jgi:hypothetical protein